MATMTSAQTLSAVTQNRHRRMQRYLWAVVGLVAAAMVLYSAYAVHPEFWAFALSLRLPRLGMIVVAGAAIAGASMVFQTVIRNHIVTPCLLGMNALYLLIHTAVVFFLGIGSALASNAYFSFALDIVIMGIVAAFIYNTLFEKTGGNVLYVLLIGTVLSTFFTSVQSSLTRMMDPNDYDALLNSLVASFTNNNPQLLLPAVALLIAITWWIRRDLQVLDVLGLGRTQAINLGIDYEPVVRRLMTAVALYIAVATALVGPLSFLGLITANLARQFFKTYRHTTLVAGSALFGMLILVVGQFVTEHLTLYSIPVSVFVTTAGGLYFLYLVLKAH